VVFQKGDESGSNKSTLLSASTTSNCILYQGDYFTLIPDQDEFTYKVSINNANNNNNEKLASPQKSPKFQKISESPDTSTKRKSDQLQFKLNNEEIEEEDFLMTNSKYDHSEQLSPSKKPATANNNDASPSKQLNKLTPEKGHNAIVNNNNQDRSLLDQPPSPR
jgi:hypothetical protein